MEQENFSLIRKKSINCDFRNKIIIDILCVLCLYRERQMICLLGSSLNAHAIISNRISIS